MKIISLTQPWALLMALGLKKIETRGWRTSYRGPLAIHAAKSFEPIGGVRGFIQLCNTEPFHQVLSEHLRTIEAATLNDYLDEMPVGAIVCVTDLVECLSTNDDTGFLTTAVDGYEKPAEDTNEYAFGNYGPDRWMWFTENLQRLREPLPYKGAQSLRILPPEIEAKVRDLL